MSSSLLYPEKILIHVEQKIAQHSSPPVITLESGHFDPRDGATEFSCESMEGALHVTEQLVKNFGRRIRIVLAVLVDDLGQDCSNADACRTPRAIFNENAFPALPDELEHRLKAARFVKRERVLVTSERNAKNRGLNQLKKWCHSPDGSALESRRLFKKGARIYLKDQDDRPVFMAEAREHRWVAKCPLIMAQHYRDVFAENDKRFTKHYPQLLIDFSQRLDRAKVNRGSEGAFALFLPKTSPHEIVNICFNNAQGTHSTYDTFNANDVWE